MCKFVWRYILIPLSIYIGLELQSEITVLIPLEYFLHWLLSYISPSSQYEFKLLHSLTSIFIYLCIMRQYLTMQSWLAWSSFSKQD